MLVSASWIAIMLPRMVVTAILPTIMRTYNTSYAQAGLLMTSYFYPYALMQIPSGSLSDRLGRKPFIATALIGSSLAALALTMDQGFEQMVAARALAGFFAGLWYAPSISLVTTSVSDRDRGKAMGLAFSGPAIADVIIFLMVGLLGSDGFGWRNYFLVYAFPGFLCAALTALGVKEGERRRSGSSEDVVVGAESVRRILTNRFILGLMIYSVVISLPMWSLRTFLPTYFVKDRGLTPSDASLLMIVYAITVVFSGPLAGYLVDRLGYGRPAIISITSLLTVIAILPFIPTGVPMMAVLLVWGLTGGWMFTALNVLLTQLVPARVRGTFLGINNSCSFFGAATGPLIFGYIVDVAGFSAFFTLALSLFIAASMVALPILRAHWKPEKSIAE